MNRDDRKIDKKKKSVLIQVVLFTAVFLMLSFGLYFFKENVIKAGDYERIYSYGDFVEPGYDSGHPIYAFKDYYITFLRRVLEIRYYIFKYAVSELDLMGNKGNAIGVWLMNDFYLYHAHDSFLMITYLFGIFAGILFFLLVIISVIYACKKLWKLSRDKENNNAISYIFSACVLIAYLIASLTECITYPGEMGLTLLFVAFLPLVRKIDFKDEQ